MTPRLADIPLNSYSGSFCALMFLAACAEAQTVKGTVVDSVTPALASRTCLSSFNQQLPGTRPMMRLLTR